MSNIAYFDKGSHPYGAYWVPLNPTGRWKISSCAYYENELYIEHQGLIFKRWVHSSKIEFRPIDETHINQCNTPHKD